MTPEDEEKQKYRWEVEDEERAWEDEHAAEVEWEKMYGVSARHASYRETLGRL